jgi:ISXO2-like transposase domain
MKRAVYGTHHAISEAHLPRYLTERDFKWNTCRISDADRAVAPLRGAQGKRVLISSRRRPERLSRSLALSCAGANVHASAIEPFEE